MTEQELRAAFDKLSRDIEGTVVNGLKVAVMINANFPNEAGEAGRFELPHRSGDTWLRIRIFRPNGVSVPGDAASELLTLVHELGHMSSWERGRPEGYLEAINTPVAEWPSMSEAKKRLVYDEEVLAWHLGRRFLPAEFDDPAGYDQRRDESLAIYRRLLALDA